jgi:predicted amidohydrolase YtcJ
LTVRAVKRLLDGALGSHGAWLLDPYADLPTSSGMQTLALDDLQRTAELAMQHDFQLCVHAIGDRANREVLDLYQRTFQAHPQRQNLRWRVEHAQHLHPDDIPRFAQLGIVAAMQTSHAVSDGPFVVARLGETRAQSGAYVWQALLQSGAVVINGSDAPVEPLDPINGFYAAVTRKMSDGQTFFPDQCMTREQALRSYTLDAAFAAFEEEVKGSLTPGKLADLIVLSQDIMTIPPEQILETRVLFTIVGGQVLHEVTPAQSVPPATGAARVRPAYPAAARAWPPRVRKLFGNLSRVLMDARAARRPMSSGTQAHGDGLAKPRPLLRDPVATDPPAQDSVADDSIVPGVE